ncbi:hypothetical protein [Listeria ilorinensis]|uniref:hypothetical protein n=1 Tax=Listeria ilorinensis TaxID=2867439 RepID=UPI001EF50CA5|nr:hypothetical protein [Listeria ilorinensis]
MSDDKIIIIAEAESVEDGGSEKTGTVKFQGSEAELVGLFSEIIRGLADRFGISNTMLLAQIIKIIVAKENGLTKKGEIEAAAIKFANEVERLSNEEGAEK